MFIFSKHYWRMMKRDLPVSEAIEALLEGNAATRNTACGRLEWMAEDKTIPNMYVGDLITALKREENQAVKTSLIKILTLIGSEQTLSAVDTFAAERAKTAMTRQGMTDMTGQFALCNIEYFWDQLTVGRPGFHAVRCALLHIVMNSSDTSGRRVRAYNVLKDMDPEMLTVLDQEVRTTLELSSELIFGTLSVIKASTRVAIRVTLKTITNDLIDSYIADWLKPVAEQFRDRLLENTTSRDPTYTKVDIGNGDSISLPDLESIPDTAFFKLLEDIVISIEKSTSANQSN